MKSNFKLTQAHLSAWFGEFNRDYFGGKLPEPRLMLSRSRTQLGSMRCKRRVRQGRVETFDYAIHVSVLFEQDEKGFKNVLLHEMIHYYIAYNNIQDTAPHGDVFRAMMNRLNSEYGWNMKVSERGKALQVAQEHVPRREYLVLALSLSSGKKMFSVVSPSNFRKLDEQIKRVREVENYGWYVSKDVYFNGYPKVRTLRGVPVSPDFFDEMLKKMEPLVLPE